MKHAIVKEHGEGGWIRAVLVALDGTTARSVHASAWSQDWTRARAEIERYAARNRITLEAA